MKRCPAPPHKQAHPTAKAARKHMAALIAKDGSERLNVYPCPKCGLWHVGHDTRQLAKDIRRVLRNGTNAARRIRARKAAHR